MLNPNRLLCVAVCAFFWSGVLRAGPLDVGPTLRAAVVNQEGRGYVVGDDGAIFIVPDLISARGGGSLGPVHRLASGVPWTLRSIAEMGSRLVIVGDHGVVLVSDDGMRWTVRQVGHDVRLNAVAFASGQLVAVAETGEVFTSLDADIWTLRYTTPSASRLNAVAYGNGMWLAVGAPGAVYRSVDGETWTATTAPMMQELFGLTHGRVYSRRSYYPGLSYEGPDLFVAVGDSGVVAKSADGTTWEVANLAGGPRLTWVGVQLREYWSAMSGNNKHSDYVAVSAESRWQTTDGTEWNNVETFAGENLLAAAPWGVLGEAYTGLLLVGANGLAVNWRSAVSVPGLPFQGSKRSDLTWTDTLWQPAQPINLSARGMVGVGGNVLIGGFVVEGKHARRFILRGVGPGLQVHGVADVLADPVLELRDVDGALIRAVDTWNPRECEKAFLAVGAFQLDPGSKDAAMVVTLQPGTYTVIVRGVAETTGVALVEVYEY